METRQTTFSEPSLVQRELSPEVNDLKDATRKLGKKLFEAYWNAKDNSIALSDRKAEAVCALESVFETGMVSFIKDLVNILKRVRNEPMSSVVEVVEQTKQDVEEISGSASDSSSSASESTSKPKRKKNSTEFRSSWSAAKNLSTLLYRLNCKVKLGKLRYQEQKQMIEDAMKHIHNAEIIEIIQDLQKTLKEIENADRSEPPRSPNQPTTENNHESTSESIGQNIDLCEDVSSLSPHHFDKILALKPQPQNEHSISMIFQR